MVPKQFELNINYRSHNGILQLASSVIDLIHHFFPDSIDHLSRERSEVGGPRPIVFKGFQAETFLFDVFSVDERMPNCSEFGAEQVIIVRNEEAKKSVGNVGIVMTVFEAKGMEFNDVLLYNFFTHSPARQKVQYYTNYDSIVCCIILILIIPVTFAVVAINSLCFG